MNLLDFKLNVVRTHNYYLTVQSDADKRAPIHPYEGCA
jgi:hypothetical protein